jgi:hypothetical protein
MLLGKPKTEAVLTGASLKAVPAWSRHGHTSLIQPPVRFEPSASTLGLLTASETGILTLSDNFVFGISLVPALD